VSESPLDTILVVDLGAQYAQLIARRVRELDVFSEIVPSTITAAEVRARQPKGLILSGGPQSVYAAGAPGIDPAIYELELPLLGICYGAQLITRDLGGTVARTGRAEYGRTEIERLQDAAAHDPLLAALGDSTEVWMSHQDSMVAVPPGFTASARTEPGTIAAVASLERRIFGVQFHPEVVHTPGGQQLLASFVREICAAAPSWTSISAIERASAAIERQIGGARALCALSGGVDSSVAAALVGRVIGDRLSCVFVDTGLMRAGEAADVERAFSSELAVELIVVHAADRFFAALKGVSDPEVKRKRIGELFIRIFEETASSLGDVPYLVQGTLYPDVVESGSGTAAVIKSHHNVGGLPEDMNMTLVEPLRLLFKDEVRAVGEQLGLPKEIVWRQPFPGPGLAVRIVGEVTPHRVEIVRSADKVFLDELRAAGLEAMIWQSLAVLLDVRTVGVMGDERTYAHPIMLRAVTSEDAMTADVARLPPELLERVARRIINEVPGVNRVAYDVTSKPPGTIEWE
jgi:GMP synthase (glutamine-hydrolysing)